MTLQEFKTQYRVENLRFFPSTVEGSSRFVAGLPNEQIIVTTVDFDPKSKELYVYKHPEADDCWVLSNKSGKPAFVV